MVLFIGHRLTERFPAVALEVTLLAPWLGRSVQWSLDLQVVGKGANAGKLNVKAQMDSDA